MSEIINFKKKKDEIELSKLLDEYVKIMPSEIETNDTIAAFKQKHNFLISESDENFLSKFKDLFFCVFEEFKNAFDAFDRNNEFSNKNIRIKMKDYDTALAILDMYIDSLYILPDECPQFGQIEELDVILDGVSAEEEPDYPEDLLKKKLCVYMAKTEKAYELIFDMLQRKDTRCKYWTGYSIVLGYIGYYAFLPYIMLKK